MNRSARADVRNPLLQLPAEIIAEFQALPPDARAALRRLALAASRWMRAKGEECWRRSKPPMASYWRSQAVWARHLARLCR